MRIPTRPQPTLVVILGPTAVGKTALSLCLAERYGCDIVSVDSRQVFRELCVGVARPSEAELARARHWFVASHTIRERFSSGQYETEALELLPRLFSSTPTVVAVGGSMLYVDALCHGLDAYPAPDLALRQQLSVRLAQEGVDALSEQLARLDPAAWRAIDRKNGARVLRALEVTLQTGIPFSQWRKGARRERPFRILKIGLWSSWTELEQRIVARTHAMLEQGLVDEVAGLAPYRHLTPLKSVGYTEIFSHLNGQCTLPQATQKIVVNTRRYAKRQMRWWQRDAAVTWFAPGDHGAIIRHIEAQ